MKLQLYRILQKGCYGIFPILTFLYFLIFVDTSIIDFKQQSILLFDNFFFIKYISYPGGIVDFFYSNYFSSFIITFLITLVLFLSSQFLRKSTFNHKFYFLEFLPSLLLVVLLSNYKLDLQSLFILNPIILFSLFYIKIEHQKNNIKIAFILVAIPLIFYLLGSISTYSFLTIILIHDLLVSKKKHILILIATQLLVSFLTIYIFSLYSPFLNFKIAYRGIFNQYNTKNILIALLLFSSTIPVIFIFSSLVRQIGERTIQKNKLSIILIYSQPLLLIVLFVIVFKLSPNKVQRNSIAIHKYASERNWNKVLELAPKLSADDCNVMFEINRALYHLDKLNDEAFSHSQFYDEHGLILTPYYKSHVLLYCSDLYHEMDYFKGSLHLAYEAQTKFNLSPNVLKSIIEDNIIISNYLVAEKFFNILSKSISHKRWAKNDYTYLYNDAAVIQSPNSSPLRNIKIENEFYPKYKKPQFDLAQILLENPQNKIAFEYFMFNLLLKHDLASIVKNLNLLEELNYSNIPQYIKETIILFQTFIGEKEKDSKPIFLSQNDPAYNETLGVNYNRPVFIKEKVDIESYKLSVVAYSNILESEFDKEMNINALS